MQSYSLQNKYWLVQLKGDKIKRILKIIQIAKEKKEFIWIQNITNKLQQKLITTSWKSSTRGEKN